MTGIRNVFLLLIFLSTCALSSRDVVRGAAGGNIEGHVRVKGKAPGNIVIRMGMDPMCARIYAGKLAVDNAVIVSDNGGLANVLVRLEGQFPPAPVPAQPVVVEQKGCFYVPRVTAARVGQVLRVRNNDNLLHNVHSMSAALNGFNIGQPVAGIQSDFKLRSEETLKLTCDVHRWMVSFVGVFNHPYFAVTATDGSFAIRNVPVGRRTIRTWHEKLGQTTQSVDVKAGATAIVSITY
jgi:hypothetical protein